MEYQVLSEDCTKSLEVKSKKKYSLPSVKKWLGKSPLCRVWGEDTRQRVNGGGPLPSVRRITLGKDQFCRVSNNNTRQRAAAVNGRQPPLILCRVSSPDTRQRGSFAEYYFLTLGKPFFFTFGLQTFSAVLKQYLILHVLMWHISQTFSIFL